MKLTKRSIEGLASTGKRYEMQWKKSKFDKSLLGRYSLRHKL